MAKSNDMARILHTQVSMHYALAFLAMRRGGQVHISSLNICQLQKDATH